MPLDALLARLEGRAVTSVTSDITDDVTPRPAPMLACTSVTPVTAENDDTARAVIEEAFQERAAIREFDGGLTRREGERLALLEFMPEGKPN